MNKSRHLSNGAKGALLSLVASLCAAAFFIPYKASLEHLTADIAVSLMLLLSAAVSTPPALLQLKKKRPRQADFVVSVLLAVLTVVGNIALAKSLHLLNPGLTSVVLQTQVLFVSLLSWLLLREKITLAFALGATLAVVGFVVIRQPQADAENSLWGLIFGLIAALNFALMQVLTRKTSRQIDPVWVNAIRLWLAALAVALYYGLLANSHLLSTSTVVLLLGAAALGPTLGRLLVMYAVRFIPASHSTLIGLGTPIFAFILGFIFFGVVPTGQQIFGGVLILLGITVPVVQLVVRGRHPPSRG